MIFTPFTGKYNHGRPVTFAAGLLCSEKTGAFAWLFRYFVECMGVALKMIVTDRDLGMRSAIEEVLVGTCHCWCMWHIMHTMASKVPNRLLRDDEFKKEFNVCVWSDLVESDEFEEELNRLVEHHLLEDIDWFTTLYEYRQFWTPAYFRDFPLGSMIRTTSISESENSFYKNFLKPRANIAEFYLNFNHTLEFQRNSRTTLDYHDATALPILATTLPFEKHASTMYTDSRFKKIQDELLRVMKDVACLDFHPEKWWTPRSLGITSAMHMLSVMVRLMILTRANANYLVGRVICAAISFFVSEQ